jgi:hypothetical protein
MEYADTCHILYVYMCVCVYIYIYNLAGMNCFIHPLIAVIYMSFEHNNQIENILSIILGIHWIKKKITIFFLYYRVPSHTVFNPAA